MEKIKWKETFKLWGFALLKISMIFWLRPRVLELNSERSMILIPFRRRTKNHLNSMYFGALSVGADLAPGLLTLRLIEKQRAKCSFVFKEFTGEFLKRCEADAIFVCDQGRAISEAINRTLISKERENIILNVIATTNIESKQEVVARFKMTISIKAK